MKANFDDALKLVLAHEGGYVNHPKDPGGATNRGVTQATFTAWLRRNGLQSRDVRSITHDEIRAIYRTQYWDMVVGDELPDGVDYAVFDFAVNSGPSRAVKFTQAIVKEEQDGALGSLTLAAILNADPVGLCADLCDNRLAWLKRLSTFSTFGRGWTRRVQAVRARSIDMARGGYGQIMSHYDPAPAPKTPSEPRHKPAVQAKDNADTLTAGGILTGLLGGATQTEGAVQLLLVVGVLALVGFVIWRRWKSGA
jgi:lysozyme family protein